MEYGPNFPEVNIPMSLEEFRAKQPAPDRSWKMFNGSPQVDSTNKFHISAVRSDMVPFFVTVELNGNDDAGRICGAIQILESFRNCDCSAGAYCAKHQKMIDGETQ